MLITRLKLVGYKRLMLSLINIFEYTPKQSLQLIIGSNGSGKSSVLDELTPVPAHHSGFVKGGMKIFECTHREFHYRLTSQYDNGTGKHSFIRIKDSVEEELNLGGTFNVQKELVEKEFGLTREIHELLTGVQVFSGLSTAKRRELLTRMTPIDLRYVFSIYNKVKAAHRDHQGVIKHLTKRMVNENQDLPDVSVRTAIENEIEQLMNKLNQLLQMRGSETKPKFASIEDIRKLLNDLVDKGVKLLKNQPVPPKGFGFRSLDDLDGTINSYSVKQQTTTELLERAIAEYDTLTTETIDPETLISEEEISDLKEQYRRLENELSTINSTLDFAIDNGGLFPPLDLPLDRQPMTILKSTMDEWFDIIHLIPNNDDGQFSLSKGEQTKQRLNTLKGLILNTDNKCNQLRRRISQLKGCESTVCPSCQHTFRPGVDPNDIVRYEAELESTHNSLIALQKEEQTHKEYDEQFDEYLSYVRRFKRLVEQSDVVFKPLWDVCLEQKIMTTYPKRYLGKIHIWYQNMEVKIKKDQIENTKNIIQHKLRFVDAVDRGLLQQLTEKKVQLEQTIDHYTQNVNEHVQTINTLQTYRQQQLRYLSLVEETITAIKTCLISIKENTEHEYQVAIREEMKHAQLLLAQKQNQITSFDLKGSLLADIQSQYDQTQRNYETDGILVKSLSPTEGIIGRYIKGFMQSVVKLINAVIAEVWTYPMEVLPSEVENDELNYYFPISVNDGAIVTSDISRGSSSQKDIINFAFKLLIMRFMDLQDMPLYLDEFGNTFDEQHRLNIIPFISRMVEMGQVSQVFFISHFATMHDAFNHADIVVLDPTNITVPEVFNQHVTIQ